MSYDAIKLRLEQHLSQILKQHDALEANLRHADGFPDDWEERAAVLQNTEVWEALEAKDKEEITATQAALARIKAGTYGTCAKCGEAIALRRLEALPTTQFCVGCA